MYPALATRNGLDRAFAKLDTIKSAIVWWQRVSEPIDMLERGELAMTTGLNSRVFSIAAEPRFGTIWEGQLYQLDVFGIPMGNPNKERGLDFIRFATGARPLAGQSELLPYGPARRSSIRLVGRNPEMRTPVADGAGELRQGAGRRSRLVGGERRAHRSTLGRVAPIAERRRLANASVTASRAATRIVLPVHFVTRWVA